MTANETVSCETFSTIEVSNALGTEYRGLHPLMLPILPWSSRANARGLLSLGDAATLGAYFVMHRTGLSSAAAAAAAQALWGSLTDFCKENREFLQPSKAPEFWACQPTAIVALEGWQNEIDSDFLATGKIKPRAKLSEFVAPKPLFDDYGPGFVFSFPIEPIFNKLEPLLEKKGE